MQQLQTQPVVMSNPQALSSHLDQAGTFHDDLPARNAMLTLVFDKVRRPGASAASRHDAGTTLLALHDAPPAAANDEEALAHDLMINECHQALARIRLLDASLAASDKLQAFRDIYARLQAHVNAGRGRELQESRYLAVADIIETSLIPAVNQALKAGPGEAAAQATSQATLQTTSQESSQMRSGLLKDLYWPLAARAALSYGQGLRMVF